MSDRPPPSVSASPTPPGKKSRHPVERTIVWGGIAILLGVLAFEARQKYSYDPTVTKLRKMLSDDAEKQLKLSEVRKSVYGSPFEVKSPHEIRTYQRVTLKWPSLFKKYEVILIVENEGTDPLVAGFSTPDGTDPDQAAKPAPSTNSTASANPMASMPMGGGQGRPGAAGRPGGAASGGVAPGGAAPGATGIAPAGMNDPLPIGLIDMARREDVARELKLNAEQIAKLAELQAGSRDELQSIHATPASVRGKALKTLRDGQEKSISETLDEPQFTRLLQLLWRDLGLGSLERDDVAKSLGLADEQREKLRPILADRQQSLGMMAMSGAGAPPEVKAQFRQELDDKVRAVLTEEQARQWEELLGPPAAASGK